VRRSTALVALLALAAACGGRGDEEAFELASPSTACEQAFTEAAAAGERPAPASPRSPDIAQLRETLEACGSAGEWMTAFRGHRSAFPVELDRSDALDRLCVDEQADTPVCRDWNSTTDEPAG
jgi:hypothetical protein